jgi:hypothetical protein
MENFWKTRPQNGKRLATLKAANLLISLVPGTRLELVQGYTPRDFKSLASTRSATQAG